MPETPATVTPGSAKFTWGHLIVVIGAVLGIAAFVILVFFKKKPKNGAPVVYS